jgi:ABC-type Fe3+/spermidine/putrescine transport system ATPase subunit
VTHDQEEAFALADRVVVMNQGQVAQIGTPREIYQRPASAFVARFLGFRNILAGEVRDGTLRTAIGDWEIGAFENREPGDVKVLIRPDAMKLEGRGSHRINGIIREREFRGSLSRVMVEIRGVALSFELPSGAPLPATGQSITFSFSPAAAIQILP